MDVNVVTPWNTQKNGDQRMFDLILYDPEKDFERTIYPRNTRTKTFFATKLIYQTFCFVSKMEDFIIFYAHRLYEESDVVYAQGIPEPRNYQDQQYLDYLIAIDDLDSIKNYIKKHKISAITYNHFAFRVLADRERLDIIKFLHKKCNMDPIDETFSAIYSSLRSQKRKPKIFYYLYKHARKSKPNGCIGALYFGHCIVSSPVVHRSDSAKHS